jgi:transposase
MAPLREFTTPQKARIRALYYDAQWSVHHVADYLQIDRHTVQRILFKDNNKRRSGKNRTGRPKKLSQEYTLEIIRILLQEGYNGQKEQYKVIIRRFNLELSIDTLRRAFLDLGYQKCVACPKPFINETTRRKRLDFAIQYLRFDWNPVVFSDELTFHTGKQRKDLILRRKGERYCPDCIQPRFRSGRSSFSVWAAIGWNFKSRLIFLEGHGPRGGCNREDYVNQVLTPISRELPAGSLLQEDGNKIHGRTSLRETKRQLGLQLFHNGDWPPSSPDLSPIENIWRVLKQRVKNRGPITDIPTLKEVAHEEWENIDQELINRYMASMMLRMEEVIKRQGMATPY